MWCMSIVDEMEAAGEVLSPVVRAALLQLEAVAAKVPLLEARIRELETRLGLNSTNSSLPPSSDPPSVSRPVKKPTGKKRGGQKGHRGHHRSLVAAERVDKRVVHSPEACGHCGHSLADAVDAKPARVHQVIELPPVHAEVTEHQMRCVRCPGCRKLTRAVLPREVGGKHFGPRLAALGTQLIGRYRLSRREAVDLLGRLLDVPAPSLGSIEALTQEVSEALQPVYAEVQAAVRSSDAACVDETPWKLQGKKQWLWVATTAAATAFHLGASRGSEELKRFMGERFGGVLSSDRWCAYQIYERRQLCWAHLIRNFRKLALRGGKAVAFAERGVKACLEVFELWWALGDQVPDRAELRRRIASVRARLRRQLVRGASDADKRVSGFCRNVLKHWNSLWTFVTTPVEPTNNAAERAVRAAVLWRKGCFGSQSKDGMRFVERILTVNATCRQQRIHPLDFVALAIQALRSGTAAPRLLQAH